MDDRVVQGKKAIELIATRKKSTSDIQVLELKIATTTKSLERERAREKKVAINDFQSFCRLGTT